MEKLEFLKGYWKIKMSIASLHAKTMDEVKEWRFLVCVFCCDVHIGKIDLITDVSQKALHMHRKENI